MAVPFMDDANDAAVDGSVEHRPSRRTEVDELGERVREIYSSLRALESDDIVLINNGSKNDIIPSNSFMFLLANRRTNGISA